MRKYFFIILLLLNSIFSLYSQSETNNIKRKILILPFYNKNQIEEYNYLSDLLMETLRLELRQTDMFEFTNFSLTNYKMKDLGYNREDFINLEIAKEICEKFKADIVVSGQYVIINEEIMILIHVIDSFTGDLAAGSKINGNTGIDLFKVIEESSKDVRIQLESNLEKLEESYIAEMEKRQKENNKKRKIKFDFKEISLVKRQKAGTAFTAAGGTLFLTGLSILIYDTAGYSNILREKRDYFIETDKNHDEYTEAYNIFIALFSSSVTLTAIGAVFIAVGIPLIAVKKKKITINLYFNNQIDICFLYKF